MKNKWLKRLGILLLTGMVAFGTVLGGSISEVYAKEDKDKDDDDDDDDDDEPSVTSSLIQLLDNYQTPTVTAGQHCFIALPVANYSTAPLRDVVVKAEVSNLVSEWPFEPNAAGTVKTIRNFPAYNRDKDIHDLRQDIGFDFTVREDVMTGYYPLKFTVTYYRKDLDIVETGTLIAYVHCIGDEEKGYLDDNARKDKMSKARIIVTGFETNPGKIFAGETFDVVVHVKNTSSEEKVTNVLFNLEATETGKDEETSYATFLPTSGSSSVYVEELGPGQNFDIVMGLSAKSDLAQKPYVLTINMTYDMLDNYDLTDVASVSIPVYQEQRCEFGDVDLSPDVIAVGEQSNITFDVYNTGKTTLYNTWVKFPDEALTGGDTYLGNIQAGGTATCDAMVTAAAQGTGSIQAVVSYENESGEITTIDKTINLTVNEMIEEDFGEVPEEEPAEAPEKSGASKYIIPGTAAGILVAIIVLAVFLKKRKQKKAEEEERRLLEEENL